MNRIRGFVSVVAPVSEAAEFIVGYIEDTLAVLRDHFTDFELILVDDASKDDTTARVAPLLKQNSEVRLVRLARRCGSDMALMAGLDTAIGDWIVLTTPETDPPTEIPAMVALARQGHGVVTGVALERPKEGVIKRLGRRLFYTACDRVMAIPYPRNGTRFQVLSRLAAGSLTRNRSKSPLFPVLAAQLGFRNTTHPYRPSTRPGAKAPRESALERALSVTVLHSISPLRLVSMLGMTAAAMNLLYAVYIVGVNLFKVHVAEGWTTLSLQMSGMFFLVFTVLVVMCEYVGRILREATDRPPYDVLDEQGGTINLAERRNVLDRSA